MLEIASWSKSIKNERVKLGLSFQHNSLPMLKVLEKYNSSQTIGQIFFYWMLTLERGWGHLIEYGHLKEYEL